MMDFLLLWIALLLFLEGPIARAVVGASVVLVVIWLVTWWKLGNASYFMDPLQEKSAFEPHLKRYQDLAKLIVTLSTATIAFLFNFLVTKAGDSQGRGKYPLALEAASPMAISFLSLSVFLLLFFLLGQTYIYESYCHQPPLKRNIYKGWLYAIQVAVGWTGFLCFLFAYFYLAFRVIG